MAVPPDGARRASTEPSFPRTSTAPPATRRRRIALARIVGAALAIAVIVPLGAPIQTVSAACGTNWESKRVPPQTIRVYRHETGNVKVVDFREYVGIVMASGEWPAYLPQAMLEVGAVVSKQYAWYYALEGHHRDWYVNSEGVCYDVRDDTADQLYKPASREVKDNQLRAVADTWGLSLRKKDRFFLTGYRAGENVPCGSDANGWKIFATSATDCAERGWGYKRILEEYLDPGLSFVWSGDGGGGGEGGDADVTAPTAGKPRTSFDVGTTLGSGSTVVSWSGSDEGSGIERFVVQRKVGGGTWKTLSLDRPRQRSLRVSLAFGQSYRFRVRAVDEAGNVSDWATGTAFVPVRHENASSQITFGDGTWKTDHKASASGGSTSFSKQAGARARLAFTGRAVAFVAPRGVERGEARIRIDGETVGRIDLRAGSYQARRVVFARTWDDAGTHTIEVVVLGTNGRPRVDVDAFLVLRDAG